MGMTPCAQCGDTNDMLVAFTRYQVCGKCTRRNHREATGTTTRPRRHAHTGDARHTGALDTDSVSDDTLTVGGNT